METLQIVNELIMKLDQLSVQGAKNMGLVLQCIQQLGVLREKLTEQEQIKRDMLERLRKAEENDVQDQAE